MKSSTVFTSDDGQFNSEDAGEVLKYELTCAEQRITTMSFLLLDAAFLLEVAKFPFTGDMPKGTGVDYDSDRGSWLRNYKAYVEKYQ